MTILQWSSGLVGFLSMIPELESVIPDFTIETAYWMVRSLRRDGLTVTQGMG